LQGVEADTLGPPFRFGDNTLRNHVGVYGQEERSTPIEALCFPSRKQPRFQVP
jgi:hypothetical protein